MNLSHVKPGDRLLMVEPSRRYAATEPREVEVVKVGRKWVHVATIYNGRVAQYTSEYSIETGTAKSELGSRAYLTTPEDQAERKLRANLMARIKDLGWAPATYERTEYKIETLQAMIEILEGNPS